MSHLCRCPSLVCYIASWLLALALGLRRWWLTGRPVGAGTEREPRRRDLFRPAVYTLEERAGPTSFFGLAVPALGNGDVNLDNLGGGGQPRLARGSARAAYC
jgi:hypothetical protein